MTVGTETTRSLGEEYLDLVGDSDEYGAVELVTGLLDDGMPAPSAS
jgi:hypothetical protein